ncbi:MAG: HPr family phosphocarrier protein [Mogibacterium sp.]|nr:HPr family phosphocarrier protein [Mogibacterium sp.]
MYSRVTTIINKTGLHARPASDFIQCASKFESKIIMKKTGEFKEIDAKSILNVLVAGFVKGTEIEITAEGPDEKSAVDTLVDLIENGFGEV